MFIRDMRKRPAQNGSELMLIMKGAPERILSRCTKILINGEEVDYNETYKNDVEFANGSLGKMGERVLAIARYNLEPEYYDRNYQFDVKNWK